MSIESRNMEKVEILEAASTLMSLRKHCDERAQWQQIRSNIYLPHTPTVINPFYNQWPFYKPYHYDIASGLHMQPQQFPFPYMVAPRPWYPSPQHWLGHVRSTENTLPSIQPPVMTMSANENSRAQVAMEMNDDDDQDDNDDSTGEQGEYLPPSADKYDQKRKRRNLTKKQQEILETAYCTMKYPHIEERLKLGKATQLTEDRIQIWFQNRRAKDRRMTDVVKSPSAPSITDKINSVESPQRKKETECLNNKGGVGRELKFDAVLNVDTKSDGEPSPKRVKEV